MLSRFVNERYERLNEDEQRLFELLLDVQDPMLNEWLYNDVVPEDQGMARIVKRILLTD